MLRLVALRRVEVARGDRAKMEKSLESMRPEKRDARDGKLRVEV